jgi:hypothetical protein
VGDGVSGLKQRTKAGKFSEGFDFRHAHGRAVEMFNFEISTLKKGRDRQEKEVAISGTAIC